LTPIQAGKTVHAAGRGSRGRVNDDQESPKVEDNPTYRPSFDKKIEQMETVAKLPGKRLPRERRGP